MMGAVAVFVIVQSKKIKDTKINDENKEIGFRLESKYNIYSPINRIPTVRLFYLVDIGFRLSFLINELPVPSLTPQNHK